MTFLRRLFLLAIAGLLFAGACHAAPKRYALFADEPATLDTTGWRNQAFPIGNGHFGVSFFGGISEELWQFTEKSVVVADPAKTPGTWDAIGLSSLCELRLTQAHDATAATAYRRELDLEKALGSVAYTLAGVTYRRETFASYPDRVFAARLTASQSGRVSFTLRALHPYLNANPNRTGTATVENNVLILRGETLPYNLDYEVRIAVRANGGTVTASAAGPDPVGTITVAGADSAEVYVTLGTNYRLESKTFTSSNANKLTGNVLPSAEIASSLASALSSNWATLQARHEADVGPLFRRASIDLGGIDPGLPTADLRASTTRSAAASRYLEELYFQFGRYLLIASSRPGTLPANLQGTWNFLRNAPWTGGIWANINIQMNYWPAFSTGLEETFEPYYAFFQAAFTRQQSIASSTLSSYNRPSATGGWTAGTVNNPYGAGGPSSTSGVGTGPFVLLPMWDWYEYTGRTDVLEKLWPFLLGSSRFLNAFLTSQPDGTLLCNPSWSPEQKGTDGIHVNLPGTAYDQQLVYENHRLTLRVANLLGKTDSILTTLQTQLPKLSPVLIGGSGQIKEFRQETNYGEYGEQNHRHISQLISLYPGTLITEKPEWLAAAEVTLNRRGDQSTGWAMAHRLNAWTRIKDGERSLSLLQTLLRSGTLANLWNVVGGHFQIDGNLGGTSGVAEMLLQSHEGFIDLLPALPKAWSTGSANGLRARGGFIVDQEWRDGRLVKAKITSQLGKLCRLRYRGELRTFTLAPGASMDFIPAPDPISSLRPYEVDANTLQLWHLDETAPPFANSANLDHPLQGLHNGATAWQQASSGLGASVNVNTGTSPERGIITYAKTLSSATTADTPNTFRWHGSDGAFTLEALVNFDTLSISGGQIIAFDGDGTQDRVFQFVITSLNGAPALTFIPIATSVTGSYTVPLPTSGVHMPTTGSWFHAAVTYDGRAGAAGNLKLYWTRLDSGAAEANLLGGTGMLSADFNQSIHQGDFSIGNEARATGGHSGALPGRIDEVRISDIARGPDGFYFKPQTPSYDVDDDTLHLWHFDETGTGPAQPATGITGSFNLVPESGATLGTASTPGFGTAGNTSAGTAAGFRGSTIPVSSVTGAGGAFTFEAMLRTSNISDVQQIMAMENSSGNAADRPFQFRIDAGQLRFINVAVGSQSILAPIPTTGPDAFVANEWFHVAVAYNGNQGTADNIRLFWTRVDASRTTANQILAANMSGDLTGTSTTFGVGQQFRTTNNNLKGSIDELRISNIARGPSDFLFQNRDIDSDGIPDSWEQVHFGRLDTAFAGSDYDKDGTIDRVESLLDLNPHSGASAWRMNLAPVPAPGGGFTMSWPARAGLRFTVERATNLATADWTEQATLTALGASASWTDTTPPVSRAFYRVKLTLP
jgi:alpha-L-fucosidase 2